MVAQADKYRWLPTFLLVCCYVLWQWDFAPPHSEAEFISSPLEPVLWPTACNKTAITWNLEPRPQVTLQHLSWPQCNAVLSPPWTKAPLLTAGTNARHVIKAIETSSPAYPPVHCGNMLSRGSLRVEPPANPSSNCLPTGLWANTLLYFKAAMFYSPLLSNSNQADTAFFSPWLGLSEPNDIPKGQSLFGQPKNQFLFLGQRAPTHRQRRHSRLVTGSFPQIQSQ